MFEFATKLQDKVGKGYLSYSSIKYALQDMRLFEMYMAGQLKKESEAFIFGSLYDDMIFSRDKVNDKYLVFDDSEIIAKLTRDGAKTPRATKEYKDWKHSLLADSGSKVVVSAEDFDTCYGMYSRLEETGILETYLKGDFQVEFNDFIDDVPVRGFLDCKGDTFITDLKTTKSVNGLRYDIKSLGYDIQAYIYTRVFGVDDYYWVGQEKSYPYIPVVYKATPETIAAGKFKFDQAIERINHYLNSPEESSMSFYKFDYV